jgi:hypothetical protein
VAEIETFEWTAILGPDVRAWSNPHQRLVDAGSVGTVHLEPGGIRMMETLPIRTPPQLQAYQDVWSYPIRVRGTVDLHPAEIREPLPAQERGQEPVSRHGTFALHRLRGILALAWDGNWLVRDFPRIREVPIPQHIGRAQYAPRDNSSTTWEDLPVTVPEWGTTAWSRLEEDPVLDAALRAYLEALSIQDEHPSLALVAFVTVFEVIGQKLDEPERCATCRQVTLATTRFRQAIGLVLSKDEIERLNVPNVRSDTAHRGELHGHEVVSSGLLDFHGDPNQTQWDFATKTLRPVREAAKRLLLQYLCD